MLWAVEAVAHLVAVVATPLEPAPPIPQGERRTLPAAYAMPLLTNIVGYIACAAARLICPLAWFLCVE